MMLLRHILISNADLQLPIEPLALLVIYIRKLSIASLSVGSATAFVLKRPTPFEFRKSEIRNQKSKIVHFHGGER